MNDKLLLKWGTLKEVELDNEESIGILKRYRALGSSFSAMAQEDSSEQKRLLCELIDSIDGVIIDAWSGEAMTKELAKRYVLGY